jgi:hypothetical protein
MSAERQRHTLWWLWVPARVLDGKRKPAPSRFLSAKRLSGGIQDAARFAAFQENQPVMENRRPWGFLNTWRVRLQKKKHLM